MSLDKAIQHGKEKRKPYTGAKKVDKTCRNHGSCDWCKCNRLYQQLKTEEAAKQALEEMECKDDEMIQENDTFTITAEIKQLSLGEIRTRKELMLLDIKNYPNNNAIHPERSEEYKDDL